MNLLWVGWNSTRRGTFNVARRSFSSMRLFGASRSTYGAVYNIRRNNNYTDLINNTHKFSGISYRPLARYFSDDSNVLFDNTSQSYSDRDAHVAYVGNIPFEVTTEELRSHFIDYNPTDVRLISNRMTGVSRGFGFLSFENEEDLQKVIELNGSDLGGKNLRINKSFGKSAPNDRTAGGRKVFLGNVSWDSSDDHVKEALSQFGEVLSVNLPMNRHTGRKRGFGFVLFSEKASADAALKQKQVECDGRVVHVEEMRNNAGEEQRVAVDNDDEYFGLDDDSDDAGDEIEWDDEEEADKLK